MEEEDFIPYSPIRGIFIHPEGRVALTPHAVEQAQLRFGLSAGAAEGFLLDRLFRAERNRKRPTGALRWTAGNVQLVTIQDGDTLVIVTAYPVPLSRRLHAAKKRRWGKHKHLLKAACRGVNV